MEYAELVKDPRRSFNADESGFPFGPKSGKVLAPRGTRTVYTITGDKTQLTVLACFNAIGQYMPPLIVYPGKRRRNLDLRDYAYHEVSANGWMTSEVFLQFLHYLSDFCSLQGIPLPILLYVDGHSTHLSLECATYCASHGIILYCLPPNAAHVLQPCDYGLFSPLKACWQRKVKSWQMENLGHVVTKNVFPNVFLGAWK